MKVFASCVVLFEPKLSVDRVFGGHVNVSVDLGFLGVFIFFLKGVRL